MPTLSAERYEGITATAFAIALAGLAGVAAPAEAQAPPSQRLTELSLEELANIEVFSVSRYPELVSRAPASIFVITAEDIRRSGATTLAEALRLAPHLQVAQIDAGQYAITARGFNGLAANKLLVLVDGRTIYTPLFSGVFWDQQDVLLEDVEQIEVVAGPGATLWGANAVNGVINVTTRAARETQGLVASAGGGNRKQTLAVRYGGAAGRQRHFRVYGKAIHVEPSQRADRLPVRDERGWVQAGFRSDWGEADDGFTIQGDAYGVQSEDRGTVGGFALGRAKFFGANLLGRWNRPLGAGADLVIQAYVDHAHRDESVLFQPVSTLFDVEVQHGLTRGAHRLVVGTGYRRSSDEVRDGFLVGFRPTSRDLNWANAYAQDTVSIGRDVQATLGLKLERNDYTGWEYQPNLRLSWTPSPERLLWGAISRAVRAPARFDRDVIRPLGGVLGGPDFVSEMATVFQLGYRTRTAGIVNWSVTTYLHDWDKLRSGTVAPVVFENRVEGLVYGLTTWGSWQVLPRWRVTVGATVLEKDLRVKPGSVGVAPVSIAQLGNDPDSQWAVRSSMTPARRHEVDAMVRRIGALPEPAVPAYTAVDARYAWRARPDLELWVTGTNLFDASHPEFGALPGRSEVERGVHAGVTWSR